MKSILIVEDDESIAELERDYLEMAGFEVQWAQTGTKGLQMALEGDFSLLLLDVMLPELDGFSICRQLRHEKDVPILFVTARGSDIDKIRGLGLGADDYVEKPFSPSVLVARVNAHIARYERLTDVGSGGESMVERGAIQAGQLRILPASRRVYVGGNEVAMANKEFELLFFLASSPDIVFSKDVLFDRIWGMDSLGDASTVTVHINRIREKLESAGCRRCVETVWGAGYRFHAC